MMLRICHERVWFWTGKIQLLNLQEDISHWSIDDISATHNNGGFESNWTGWILTIPSNVVTSGTCVHNQNNSAHAGSSYLYDRSQNAPADLKQTFNVIQGQNINISYWWSDGGSFVKGRLEWHKTVLYIC